MNDNHNNHDIHDNTDARDEFEGSALASLVAAVKDLAAIGYSRPLIKSIVADAMRPAPVTPAITGPAPW